jgi:hypothetical protein
MLILVAVSFSSFRGPIFQKNLKSLGRVPVLPAGLDRVEAEQEDDQNENDRCEAHGLFVQR